MVFGLTRAHRNKIGWTRYILVAAQNWENGVSVKKKNEKEKRFSKTFFLFFIEQGFPYVHIENSIPPSLRNLNNSATAVVHEYLRIQIT